MNYLSKITIFTSMKLDEKTNDRSQNTTQRTTDGTTWTPQKRRWIQMLWKDNEFLSQ